jgi:protein translocase SecG subunit
MLTGFIIFCHAIVCVLLTSIILLQAGRGGGLTESFASAGEMFGAQTNTFLVKGTSILATCFLVTCLGLALLSARKSESLMSGRNAPVLNQTLSEMDTSASSDEIEMNIPGASENEFVESVESVEILDNSDILDSTTVQEALPDL